jgi:hypothetical protein
VRRHSIFVKAGLCESLFGGVNHVLDISTGALGIAISEIRRVIKFFNFTG